MALKRVRLSEVAAAAGVSRTTASFVLNGRDAAIPAETRQRVLDASRRLGYHPHAAARALATGRTYRIGIVYNQPESFGTGDTYFTEVFAGIIGSALRHNHNLLLHSAHYPDWQALCSDILSGAEDGVLLVARYASDALTPALMDAQFPTVCLSYSVDHPRCYSVDCDNESGAYRAVQHLLSLGHHEIAFYYPGEEMSWGRERLNGALMALAEARLPADRLHRLPWVEVDLPSREWVEPAVEFLTTTTPRPTAAICCEEMRARMLVEALPQAGIRVPEDCAVISFNSTEISHRARPPMTSVWQPLREIGATGLDMLVDLIEGRELVERRRRLAMRLDVRLSCGAGARALVHETGPQPVTT